MPLLTQFSPTRSLGAADKVFAMQLRTGYELIYSFPQPTPIILVVNIHDSRAADVVVPDRLTAEPSIPMGAYRDLFGNLCHRTLAPAGRLRLTADAAWNNQPVQLYEVLAP